MAVISVSLGIKSPIVLQLVIFPSLKLTPKNEIFIYSIEHKHDLHLKAPVAAPTKASHMIQKVKR